MENKILIKKKYLIFREDAKKIAQKIKKSKAKKVSIDFTKTEFFSRSFIDELISQIENQRKKIKFLGLNPSFAKLFSKVKETRKEIQKTFSRS